MASISPEVYKHRARRMDHALDLMKQKKVACDFEIRSEDGKSVAVHRAVLIATSKYFENLFSTESKEVQDGYVVVKDLTIQGIECCMEYIYTDKIQITSSNVESTLEAANTWQLNDLVQICNQYLQDGLSPQKEKRIYSQENVAGPLTVVMLDEGTGILTALNVEEGDHKKITNVPNFKKGDFVKITSIGGELHLLQNEKFYKYSGQNWKFEAKLDYQPDPYAQLVTSHQQDKVYLICKNTMVRYNVSKKIWSDPWPGCGQGMHFCLAASPDSIYVIGGLWDWYNAKRYDPDSGKWLKANSQKHGRRGAAATFYQNKIYVFGGSGIRTNKKTVECYDPHKAEWSDLADLNKPRAWCAAVVYDDRLYAVGGWPERDIIEVYNQALNRWEEKGEMPKHEGIISVCVCKL